MRGFIEGSQLQLCCSEFMCLPFKVVQHILHTGSIPIATCHKLGCPTMYHINFVFLVSFMSVPDDTAVVEPLTCKPDSLFLP